ncbi:MAG: hypothetical protein KF709_04940 [Gemmatimonadaceae bacterium]|nr:hypothetical protein [Gemmatimonadaceae bacterium]
MDDDGNTLELHRFCRACWPEARRRILARLQDEFHARVEAMKANRHSDHPAGDGWSIGGASWDGVIDLLRDVQALEQCPRRPSVEMLAELCAEWPTLEREFEEPMPPELRAFYEAHHPGAN